MGLVEERHDRLVRQLFGHQARLGGSIIVGEQTVGVGKDFQAALSAASRQVAARIRAVAPVIAWLLVALW